MSQVPDDKKDFISKVVKWKDIDDSIDIVKQLSESYKKKDFVSTPSADGSVAKIDDKYMTAQSKGDLLGMIANAPNKN
jgi:hypothetical protein